MCFSYHRACLMGSGLVVLMANTLPSVSPFRLWYAQCITATQVVVGMTRSHKGAADSAWLCWTTSHGLLISSLSYLPLPSTLLFLGDRKEDTPLSVHQFLPHHCFFGAVLEPKRSPFISDTILFLWFMICFKTRVLGDKFPSFGTCPSR